MEETSNYQKEFLKKTEILWPLTTTTQDRENHNFESFPSYGLLKKRCVANNIFIDNIQFKGNKI